MKLTNKLNLPESIYNVVNKTIYKPRAKHYGVTTLLKDYCEIILYRRYFDELEEDVSDNIWAIYGTAIHEYIKAHDTTKYSEYRLSVPVSDSYVDGVVDLYDNETNTMIDYKNTTAWKVLHKDYEDYREQLLIYCWMLRECENIKCNNARIIAILRDWSRAEMLRYQDYPKRNVVVIDFTFTDEEIEEKGKWVEDKIKDIEKLKFTSSIKECDEKHRWTTPTKFAVYKNDNKTATKLCDTREDAEQYIELAHDNNTYKIIERKGEDKKCNDYCLVASHCPYHNGKVK